MRAHGGGAAISSLDSMQSARRSQVSKAARARAMLAGCRKRSSWDCWRRSTWPRSRSPERGLVALPRSVFLRNTWELKFQAKSCMCTAMFKRWAHPSVPFLTAAVAALVAFRVLESGLGLSAHDIFVAGFGGACTLAGALALASLLIRTRPE